MKRESEQQPHVVRRNLSFRRVRPTDVKLEQGYGWENDQLGGTALVHVIGCIGNKTYRSCCCVEQINRTLELVSKPTGSLRELVSLQQGREVAVMTSTLR